MAVTSLLVLEIFKYFVVQDAELLDIHVGVCADGIHVYHHTLHVNRFPWPKITKMSYKGNVFYVKIRPGAVSHVALCGIMSCISFVYIAVPQA